PPAVVFVDDDPVGRSPLRRQLPVGSHRVRVRAQGYRAGDAAIRIRAGKTVNLVLPLVPDTPAEVPKVPPPAPPRSAASAPGDPFAASHAVTPASSSQTTRVVSAMPRSPVPKPTLPRLVRATESERLWQVCQMVELLVVSRAGVTREFARGITGPLRRQVG